MKNFKICVLISLGMFCYAQVPDRPIGNPCISRETCGDCIAAHPECTWCSKEDFHQYGSRCDFIRNLHRRCEEHQIVAPAQIEIMGIKEEELSQKDAGDEINLTPQEISLKLRTESRVLLDVKFRQSQDNPVDLYLLTDLSNPMKDVKENVDKLAELLGEEMRNITQNFRLGFGSFVGDVVMNSVSTENGSQISLCPGCTAPYGFHNHVALTMDTNSFIHRIRDAEVSGNLDKPEGVFDAIMQAIVCQNQIGWREKSKKILVFTSNSTVRYAGDGKNPRGWIEKSKKILVSSSKNFFSSSRYRQLGEMLQPNDGFCHLDPYGYYTENIHQDYPSLSQINRKIQESKVNIIFAVTAEQVPEYETLSSLLEGSRVVRLENDSSNIIDLVRNQSNKMTSSVEMRDNAGRNIQITYHSNCLGDEKEKTNICEGLKAGTNVTFQVDLEVTSCPKDPNDWIQTFQIYPVGIAEALTVNLEMTCGCDCEKPWNTEQNSRMCFGNGTYECGICKCNDDRFGRKCECEANGGACLL